MEPINPAEPNNLNAISPQPPIINRKNLLIISIILGVLFLGVGAVSAYYWYKQNYTQKACTLEAKICPDGSSVGRTGPNCEFAACPSVTPDETAGWQTYQDKVFGFEIKYPPDWINEYERIKENVITISVPGSDSLSQPEWVLSISSKAITAEDSINIQNGLPKHAKSEKKVTLNNVEFTKYNYQSLGSSPSQFILLAIHNGRYYEISSAENPQVDQILATFKFIEVDAAGWHVYENKDLGFSFSYPAELGDVIFGEGSGETGKKFGASFSHNRSLIFGGASPDFSYPRSGVFTDTGGHIKKDGKYYIKYQINSSELIEKSLVKEIQAENTTGILILGKNYEGPAGLPYQDEIGALFNLQNETFPGIGFLDGDLNKFNQSDFEKMLSTFKITK